MHITGGKGMQLKRLYHGCWKLQGEYHVLIMLHGVIGFFFPNIWLRVRLGEGHVKSSSRSFWTLKRVCPCLCWNKYWGTESFYIELCCSQTLPNWRVCMGNISKAYLCACVCLRLRECVSHIQNSSSGEFAIRKRSDSFLGSRKKSVRWGIPTKYWIIGLFTLRRQLTCKFHS